MSNFTRGLLGAVSGAAQQHGNIVNKQIEDEAQLKKMRSVEEIKAEMEQKREARLKEQKIAENKKVREVAGGLAGKERGAQMDEAKAIYEKSGMSPEDIALGVGATEEARHNVEPEREHYVAAMEQEGLLTAGQRVADMDEQEKTKYGRDKDTRDFEYGVGRDKVADEFKQGDARRADRQLSISEQNARNSAALNAVQVKTANLAHQRAVEENKIPAAVSKQYAALSTAYANKTKIIDAAMAKGEFAADSPQAIQLLEDQSALATRMTELLDPYTPADSKKKLFKDVYNNPPAGKSEATTQGDKAKPDAPAQGTSRKPESYYKKRAELEAKYGRGNIPKQVVIDNPEYFTPEEIAKARGSGLLNKWND